MTAGRPSDYSLKIVSEICDRIADGESMRGICQDAHLPNRRTVLRWLEDERYTEFTAKYVRARVHQGDAMDDLILDTADKCTSETAAADRVKIDAYKWRAMKLNPKRYGERTQLAPTDVEGNDLQMAPIMFVPVEAKET